MKLLKKLSPTNFKKKFFASSINTKIVLSFLTIAAMLLIIETLVFTQFSYQIILTQVTNHLETTASLKASEIEHFIQVQEEKLFITSQLGSLENVLTNNQSSQEAIDELNEILESQEAFATLYLVNSEGKILTASNQSLIGMSLGKKELEGARPECVTTGIKDCKILGEKALILTKKMSIEGVEGVLVGLVEVSELDKIVVEIPALGRTGEAYLVNSEKNMLTPSKFVEGAPLTQEVNTLNTQACLNNRTLKKHVYEDYRGELVVGANEKIKEQEWCLLVEIDEEEALGAWRARTILTTIVLLAVLFASMALIGYAVTQTISDPIKKLEKAAERIKEGNYSQPAVIRTGDEFEVLGEAVNQAMESLSKTERERKIVNKLKSRFVSITSHELRSPMTPIKAQAQMLLKEYFGKLNKKQEKALKIIERNIKGLDKIIKDFLEVSRIESARLEMDFKKTNVKKIVDQIVREMKAYLPEKKIEVKKSVTNATLKTDPDRVKQVLRNLISNAKKFSPKKTTITIKATPREDDVLFRVKDEGIGIPKKYHERIFEPFFQIEQTIYREHGGTGLGLAIVKGIIQTLGGRIWVKSEKGKGSEFFFTIPEQPPKEIKPIKLLFSKADEKEEEIKRVFQEYLGPVGRREFRRIKQNEEMCEKSLLKYIDILEDIKVINEKKAQKFKKEVSRIFRK